MQTIKTYLYNLFIPHEGNNFRAKTLHINFLTYYLVFAIFLVFTLKFFYIRSGDILGYATDISVDKLYQLTNTVRQENSLTPLTYNNQLADAANKKAADIFAKNYWSHYAPDGKTPWDFIISSGYQYEFAGENLAKNFLFSQGVIDAWMNSSSHRENILRKDYTDIGFAVVNGRLNDEETTLVVQMFGKPLGIPIAKTAEAQNISVKAEEPVITQSVSLPKQNQDFPKSSILAQKSNYDINTLPKFSFNSNLVFLIFLVLAVLLDFYFAAKLHIIRVNSKNLAHLIFIGFLIIGLFIFVKGAIL